MGFPLTVNGRGYVVKIKGKTRWICSIKKSRKEALEIYHRKAASLTTGLDPLPVAAPARESGTVHDVLNLWVLDRRGDAASGRLGSKSWVQYKLSAKRISGIIGHLRTSAISPDTIKVLFEQLAKAYTVGTARRAISHLRTAFREGEDRGWCGHVRLGRRMIDQLISTKTVLQPQWKLYGPADLRRLVAHARRDIRNADGRGRVTAEQLYAMILLALNGGMGAKELSDLKRAEVDMVNRVLNFKRFKTGQTHTVPLWQRSVDALAIVMDQRENDDLVFRTREGNPWCRSESVLRSGKLVRAVSQDNVNWRFTRLVDRIGIRIKGQGFYKLKHVAASAADAAGDPHGTYVLFGHKLPGVKGHYVRIELDRLRKIVDFMEHVLLSRPKRSQLPHLSAQPQSRSSARGKAKSRQPKPVDA